MRTRILAVAAALVLGSCTKSQPSQQSEAAQPGARAGQGMGPGMMGPGMAGICPTAVANTAAHAEEVDGGAAIAFTATGDVAEVRRRVARMAEMYNRRQTEGHGFMLHMGPGTMGPGPGRMGSGTMGMGPGRMAGDMHGSQVGGMPGGMMGGDMMMPPSIARSDDIEGGARLVLTPRDPAQLPTLQQHTQQMAAGMDARQCPMMDRADQGSMPVEASRQGGNP